MCTDGLWNYLPDADDIARFCTPANDTRMRQRARWSTTRCRPAAMTTSLSQ